MKVLVFDDQAAIVEALRVLFRIHGISMLAASTREEMLSLVTRDDVGVVIQDMNFTPHRTSGEEGVALFREIRAAVPDTPILLITAWASLETAVQLVKEGATDYLSKPWDDDKLLATVRHLLRMRALQADNERLQRERDAALRPLAQGHDLCGLVYRSAPMHRVVQLAIDVAGSDAPVLITGPNGSGKEKIAEIIRANSRRRAGPFIKVNLGALPENLMESELFGAEPGAYTGIKARRAGRFEAAHGGTIFLDEIDALPLSGQVKLLRVLQSGEYQRLGSSATLKADTRILSATNADLRAAIADDVFREDLFFRLNVIEVTLPSLAARPEDILPLARHFTERYARQEGIAVPEPTSEATDALENHPWPGNVRELENRIHRAVLVGRNGIITVKDLDLGPSASLRDPARDSAESDPTGSDRRLIEETLVRAGGVVARAAEELGVSRQALYRRMSRLGIVMERRPKT